MISVVLLQYDGVYMAPSRLTLLSVTFTDAPAASTTLDALLFGEHSCGETAVEVVTGVNQLIFPVN